MKNRFMDRKHGCGLNPVQQSGRCTDNYSPLPQVPLVPYASFYEVSLPQLL